MDKLQDTIDILKEYHQEHIVDLLIKLDKEQQNELIKQIYKIDFHQIMELYNNTKREIQFKESKIETLKYLEDKSKLDEILKIGKEKAELQANKKIREVYDKLGILG